MSICASSHPARILNCQRPKGNHELHTSYCDEADDFIDWPNEDYIRPAPTRSQREGKTRKKLKDMATRTREALHKPSFFPTDKDMRGRTALYLQKYRGEWIGLDELEMKTVGGKGALRSIQELTHHFGWNIAQKMGPHTSPTHFKLISES